MKKVKKILRSFNIAIRAMINKYIHKIKLEKDPIFIVGCGHSGTTLLLKILGSHSRIYAIPKETRCATKTKKKFYKHSKRFNRICIAEKKHRWVEKTPGHIRHLDKIFTWKPKAKVIIMLRDGRDVAASFKKRHGDLKQGIERWVNDNEVLEKYENHSNVKVVKYEDLIVDFENTLKDIISFLDEPYEEDLKNYHNSNQQKTDPVNKPPDAFGENHRQNRIWQVNPPIFDGRD